VALARFTQLLAPDVSTTPPAVVPVTVAVLVEGIGQYTGFFTSPFLAGEL
jgi:hypothetical protein